MAATKTTTASAACPECEIGSFARNYYFTGKLLVERDFRQEQDYYVNKLRLTSSACMDGAWSAV